MGWNEMASLFLTSASCYWNAIYSPVILSQIDIKECRICCFAVWSQGLNKRGFSATMLRVRALGLTRWCPLGSARWLYYKPSLPCTPHTILRLFNHVIHIYAFCHVVVPKAHAWRTTNSLRDRLPSTELNQIQTWEFDRWALSTISLTN